MKKPAWAAGLSLVLLIGCPQPQQPQTEDPVRIPVASHRYVSFPAHGSATPLQVAARLSLPTSTQGKVPAVVIAHGSGGVDTRGSFYAQALHEAGIATTAEASRRAVVDFFRRTLGPAP